MTRASRNVSLTQDHCDLIAQVARERRMKFSEVLRIIIDFALDRDATMGLPFHADRVKSLQAELVTAQEAISSLEQQEKGVSRNNAVFEQVDSPLHVKSTIYANPTGLGNAPKASYVDKRQGRTEEDRFLKAVPYLTSDDKVVPQELKKKVLAQAREHPLWVAKVPEPERNKLEAMLKIPIDPPGQISSQFTSTESRGEQL